jgi:hypothetical protein
MTSVNQQGRPSLLLKLLVGALSPAISKGWSGTFSMGGAHLVKT